MFIEENDITLGTPNVILQITKMQSQVIKFEDSGGHSETRIFWFAKCRARVNLFANNFQYTFHHLIFP